MAPFFKDAAGHHLEGLKMPRPVNYSGLDELAARQKAISQVTAYLGTDNFLKVRNSLLDMSEPLPRRVIILGLSLLGIKGETASIFAEYILAERAEKEPKELEDPPLEPEKP